MSVASISQSRILGEDVLQMIFQQLEDEDLVNCEAVCRQWRDILLAGTPWRRLFHRKKKSFPLWRYFHRKLESSQLTLRTEQYRDIYQNILQVNRNWRTGNFTKLTLSLDRRSYHISISDDYVDWNFDRDQNGQYGVRRAFLDTESMKITEIPFSCEQSLLRKMEVRSSKDIGFSVEIRDPKNHSTLNVRYDEENGYNYHPLMTFGSNLLVFHYDVGRRERMRVWKMENPPTLLHDRTFEYRNLRILKVDERFIVATNDPYPQNARTFIFFSTETLEEFTSLSVLSCPIEYDRGLLFQYQGKGIVQIFDVASGIHFNDVHLPFREEDERIVEFLRPWASSNSNVMVFGWMYSSWSCSNGCHLSVYDLEAGKKRNSDPGCYLLYTLQFKVYISRFVMNETQIAVNENYNQTVTVLKFANFNFDEQKTPELKENSEANDGDFKMRIVYDSCVGSYPC